MCYKVARYKLRGNSFFKTKSFFFCHQSLKVNHLIWFDFNKEIHDAAKRKKHIAIRNESKSYACNNKTENGGSLFGYMLLAKYYLRQERTTLLTFNQIHLEYN